MSERSCQPGLVMEAMRRHHASPAVEVEAAALEQELLAERLAPQRLLAQIGNFARQYPATLLREDRLLACLGEACLEVGRQQPAGAGAALLTLVRLLQVVIDQALRQGPASVGAELPRLARHSLRGWSELPLPDDYLGSLVEALLALGRQVALVGEEGEPPEPWFELLALITRLALRACRRQLERQFVLPGDDEAQRALVEAHPALAGFAASARERDLEWLAGLADKLQSGRHPSMDVFLELSTWQRRTDREHAFGEWLGQLAAALSRRELSGPERRQALELLMARLEQVQERRATALLAASLLRHLPYLVLDLQAEGFRLRLLHCVESWQRYWRQEPDLLQLLAQLATALQQPSAASP